jgi:hypothetical protein
VLDLIFLPLVLFRLSKSWPGARGLLNTGASVAARAGRTQAHELVDAASPLIPFMSSCCSRSIG